MRRLLPLLLLAALPAAAAVTGTVVSSDGAPLAGARVRAFAREPFSATAARLLSSTPEASPIATAETAADGRFSLDTKGNAAVDLVVDAAGREPAALYAADRDDAGAIPLASVDKTRRIRVKGADGKPLANALVYLGHALVVRTDAEGGFARGLAGEAAYVIHPDYGVGPVTMDRNEEMTLHRGAAVRGRVVGRDGTTPVAGAMISAGGWPLARSAEDGTFTIAHAPARFHALLATKGNDAGSATVDSAKPSTTIRLGNAASLSGTVVTKGDAPVAGATINLFVDGELYSAVSDAKGRYSIAAIPPGSYNAQAYHPSFVTARGGNIRAAAATTHAFALQPRARVRGVVVGEDHKPVAGAFVGGGLTNLGANSIVMTTPAGEFNVTYAMNGPLFVEAWKSGYAVAISPPFTVKPGETKSGVTLTLQRGFPLQVKVVDRDKQPVANAAVDIQIVEYADTMRTVPVPCSVIDRTRCRLTGADGTMETRLGEGKYTVFVAGTDFVPKTLPQQALDAHSSPLVVTVERGAEVSGRVMFTDGTPVADARVTTSAPNGGMSATSDASGAFTLKQLPRTAQSLTAATMDETPLRGAPVPVTPPARNVTITLATPARVEGRVIDRATSQPLTSFNVAVMGRGQFGGMRGLDVTNADGTFALNRVQPGSFDLRVTAPGYVAGSLSDLSVEEGKALTGVEVRLDRGVRITGHVTAAGNAAAGVRVSSGMRTRRALWGQTDDNGDYVLDGVAPGEQTLDFTKEGFITKHKNVTVEAGKDARVDADLDRGREIHGRVVDRNGQPVRMANVSARPPSMAGYLPGVTTDDDGQFTISGLEDGRYTVRANKNGWVGSSIDDVDPAAGRPLTLTLDHGTSITGRVIGLAPEELSLVRVSASGNNANSSQQTDANGNFTLPGIPDGSVTITAFKQGVPMRQSAPKVIDVVNGSAPPVEIDFSAGITIRGRVTRNGTPVIGGNISFTGRGRAMARVPYAMIGADGSYEVSGVDPGDYDVRVFSMGLSDAVPYTVVSNATFDVDLKGATVSGVALDADSGAPLPDVRVNAMPAAGSGLKSGRSSISDSNGAFSFDVLPDGAYNVRGEHDRYAPATQTITVSGGSAAPIELRLSHGQEAVVRIVDADSGAGIDGNVVLIDKQTKRVAGTSGYGRGDDGANHVWAAPGSYTARVMANGYLQESADLVVPGPEVRVGLHRAGTIVVTSRSGGRFSVNGRGQSISVPAGGRVPFGSLAAGVYEVDKFADDGTTIARRYTVTLPPGQTVTLDAD